MTILYISDKNDVEVHTESEQDRKKEHHLDDLFEELFGKAISRRNKLHVPTNQETEHEDIFEPQLDKDTSIEPLIKVRSVNTFIHDTTQYLKVGDLYIKIPKDDSLISISRSCYYKNRQRATDAKK